MIPEEPLTIKAGGFSHGDINVLHAFYLCQPGKVPGILIIVDGDLISLIKDHIARHPPTNYTQQSCIV